MFAVRFVMRETWFAIYSFVAIGKTEVVNNNLNPVWNPITINCATFNDKNDQLPLKIECFDFDDDGKLVAIAFIT